MSVLCLKVSVGVSMVSIGVCGCLKVSVVVWRCLDGVLRCLKVSVGVCIVSEGVCGCLDGV